VATVAKPSNFGTRNLLCNSDLREDNFLAHYRAENQNMVGTKNPNQETIKSPVLSKSLLVMNEGSRVTHIKESLHTFERVLSYV